MDLIWSGLAAAIKLIINIDPEVRMITLLSLQISITATFLSLFIGIPLGVMLAMYDFPLRRFVVALVNTGMGLPPVVAGLVISLSLWRSGPFGFLEILYTPSAMIIAQVLIAAPIVVGLSMASLQQINPKLPWQVLSLGASKMQMFWKLILEAKLPLLAAIMAGFGGVISEVGAVMMVGGNIKGQTRVLTTAIVTETRMGHFEIAIALSIILLTITFLVNLFLTIIQQRGSLWTGRLWR
jgi:tungstate transport system permease protein